MKLNSADRFFTPTSHFCSVHYFYHQGAGFELELALGACSKKCCNGGSLSVQCQEHCQISGSVNSWATMLLRGRLMSCHLPNRLAFLNIYRCSFIRWYLLLLIYYWSRASWH
jgi:hypothetical protein